MSSAEATLADQRESLGRILGLEGPVSEAVLRAAVADETYAANLLVCRRDPTLLQFLLANPPRKPAGFSTAQLLARGAKSLAKWAATGFTTVEDAVYERRLAACAVCPDLVAPPEAKADLYRLVGVRADVKAVCQLCGCAVARKARMTSESCPGVHPERPGQTRWGEPRPAGVEPPEAPA